MILTKGKYKTNSTFYFIPIFFLNMFNHYPIPRVCVRSSGLGARKLIWGFCFGFCCGSRSSVLLRGRMQIIRKLSLEVKWNKICYVQSISKKSMVDPELFMHSMTGSNAVNPATQCKSLCQVFNALNTKSQSLPGGANYRLPRPRSTQ